MGESTLVALFVVRGSARQHEGVRWVRGEAARGHVACAMVRRVNGGMGET
jgi:hypothetical protein